MIIFGSKSKSVVVGQLNTTVDCDSCKQPINYIITCAYKWGHLYWFFGFLINEFWNLHCPSCKDIFIMPESALATLKNSINFENPISWYHRYGLLAFIVSIISLILLFSITNQ